jgi:type II secretory pathway pseudopilin PulG
MVQRTTNRRARFTEEGYILVAVMFMLAVLVISMAVAVPRIREDIQRDREVETIHRGKQYIRAVQLYYKKFHAYPPTIDALVKTSEIRFLRKRYIDPITGKDDWKPILFGQTKAPLVMGFFGQPLAGGSILGGTGAGGIAGATPIGGTSGNSTFGNGTSAGGSFSNGSSFSNSSSFGSSSTSSSPVDSTGTGTGAGASAGSGMSGSDSGSNSGSGSGLSTTQTFGGGGIIGVSPDSSKQSILVYKTKSHYNEWEFVYSPLMDMMMQGTGNTGTIGQPAGGNSGGFGTSPGGSSPGNSGGFSLSPGGTSPTTPTAPTTPTSPTTPQQ